jgi:hypothetical protein
MKLSFAISALIASVVASDASTWTTLTPSATPTGATDYSATFGIAVIPQSSSSSSPSNKKRDVVSQVSDGQVQASTATQTTVKTTSTAQAISQIGDGQIQASTSTKKATSTAQAVSQIGDGQIQASTSTKKATSTAQAVSQIGDGQIQASTATTATTSTAQAISQISDGQIQASTKTTSTKSGVSQIIDGQVQATTLTTKVTSSTPEETSASDASVDIAVVSCKANGSLALTLKNSILYDSQGRVGSIVANRQFQFDGPPPQAGAIYAAGWSITDDGYLALGDSDVFYQCLSGTFYNLYDESIGSQCVEIKLEVVKLIDC